MDPRAADRGFAPAAADGTRPAPAVGLSTPDGEHVVREAAVVATGGGRAVRGDSVTEGGRVARVLGLLGSVLVAGALLSGTARAQGDPEVVVFTPSTQVAAEVGVPVVVAGGSITPDPEAIRETQLTFDGGRTWEPTTLTRVLPGFRTDWRHLFTPQTPGDVRVAGRAVLRSGEVGPVGDPVTIKVGGTTVPQPVNCTPRCQFGGHYAQSVPDPDDRAVEVGLRFRVDRPGSVVSAAFERGAYRGPVLVRLWSEEGVLLAEQPYDQPYLISNVAFAAPVPVEPGHDYVISYYTPQGGYVTSEFYFTGTVASAPFIAPHDGTHGAGVYHYGVGGGFPTDSWHDSTYWVLPEFRSP